MPRPLILIALLLAISCVPIFLPTGKIKKPSSPITQAAKPLTLVKKPSPQTPTTATTATTTTQPDLTLPPIDHTPLLLEAKALEKKGRYRFATSRQANIAPHLGGTWTTTPNRARWQYKIHSSEAHSLNLGFSEFHLPADSTLTISDPSGHTAPITFTATDNDSHQQLWTPIFPSDQLTLTLDLPKKLAPDLRLRLTKINHGFRPKSPSKLHKAIGDSSSGSCNIDVICNPSDDPTFGPLIDLYRDQIRSVAAYTISGTETCSGALINNSRNDRTPFFLTADHCEISTANAPSVVVYWNFENSTCRSPGSSDSGANGNGSITQFNSGAIFRAARSQSDFCLIELDDPVSPTFLPFYAGWDRSGSTPNSVTGIHHPSVSEKRISFAFDPTYATNDSSDSPNPSGSYLRVPRWDFGTTEPGSSGSPLFDDGGKIIGQLFGGFADCGNSLPDWYGRLASSWSNGGSPSTQLSTWLDPDNTGLQSISGINGGEILTVSGGSITEGNTGISTANATVTLSAASSETVTVSLLTQSDTATSDDFSGIVELITFNPGETTKIIPISIIGDTTPEEHEVFLLSLLNATNATASTQTGKITILNDDFITPLITSSLSAQTNANAPFEYRITAQNTPSSFAIANPPTGMTIEPLTGIISWTPFTLGTQTVNIIATNPAGSDTRTLTLNVVPNTLAIALDLTSSNPLSNSSPGWSRQTNTTFDGIDAAQTDPINDNERASFSLQLNGPDLLDYQFKVSSEQNYDFLSIQLNGIEKESHSGEIDWQAAQIIIPSGPHTLTFSYIKDNGESQGSDSAWLDSFALASTTGKPAIISPQSVTLDAGTAFTYTISSIDPNANYTITNLPAGLSFDGASTLSGTTPAAGNYPIGIQATTPNSNAVDNITLILNTLDPIAPSVETPDRLWTRGGQGNWIGQQTVTYDGIDAAASGTITHQESSSMSIQVTGPDRLSFQWKISSENFYDKLSLLLNGQETTAPTTAPISGEVDWTPAFFTIPSGTHTLTWQYSKDRNGSAGNDTAWVDDLRFASGTKPLIWADGQNFLITGSPARIPLEFINTTSYSFSELPSWLSYQEETQQLLGTPPSPGSYPITATALGLTENTTLTFHLTVLTKNPTLAAALDQADLPITSLTTPWTVLSDASATGGTLARSGQITHDQSSSLTLHVQGPGTLHFHWKVSSEPNFDLLRYSLDNNPLSSISGEVDWEKIEVPLSPGPHQITWTYLKDEATSAGADAGYLDNITLSGYPQFLSNHNLDHFATTPSDDPDGNGLTLLHEYAFLQNPGDFPNQNLLTLTPSPNNTATLNFLALPPDRGLIYQLQSSPTLSPDSWTALPGAPQTTLFSANADYTLTIPYPSPDKKNLFYRIRARFD